MEVAATAIGVLGLVGLYSTCIETLDALSSAARYGVERELLQTKIEVERVRLMIWGDSVGLTDIDLSPGKNGLTEDDLSAIDESLQRPALCAAVVGLLTCFVRTFEDIDDLQKRYGLAPQDVHGGTSMVPSSTASVARQQPTRELLSSTFRRTYARFQDRAASSQKNATPLHKAAWAVADAKKFRALIAELRAINDSLTSLLPAVRDRARVRMRTEIMHATDIRQLQSLVGASDDAADLIAETASLRIEMLSTKAGQAGAEKPTPRVVHVAPAPAASPSVVGPATPPQAIAPASPVPAPVVLHPPKPAATPFVPYDDSGVLVLHKVYKSADSLMCYAWLSSVGEAPELSTIQPEFHPAFELRFLPESVLPVAENLVQVDVQADPQYAGWSPGSTSLTGFSRELNFWRQMDDGVVKKEPIWERTHNTVPHHSIFILKRWNAIVEHGLGDDWTEKKGYDSVRELCGPSDSLWLNKDETIKIRHQISDLLALMGASPLPSLEETSSIGALVNVEQTQPSAGFGFVDFCLQMLVAREVTLRMAKAQRRWYGGITVRIIYDLVAAELWSKSIIFPKDPSETRFEPQPAIKEQQLRGILKFAEEMQWPYLEEIRATGEKLLRPEGLNEGMSIRMWDWFQGLLLPGAAFLTATIGALYDLSPTLRTRLPTTIVKIRKGNFGIVYPQASYWSVRSILGKVLAPLSQADDTEHTSHKIKCIGGWVGPCLSPSLAESTFGLLAELKGRPPPWIAEDRDGGGDGGATGSIPKATELNQTLQANAADWALPIPPPPSTETVKLQTLRLAKASVAQPADASDVRGDDASPIYQARLDFRVGQGGRSLATMTLHANSTFLAALPCRGGPHRIDPRTAATYTVRSLSIDQLAYAELDPSGAAAGITVINATADPMAETYARAWCCEKGTNAVIWKRGEGCCFKCALMVAGKEGVATGVLIMC